MNRTSLPIARRRLTLGLSAGASTVGLVTFVLGAIVATTVVAEEPSRVVLDQPRTFSYPQTPAPSVPSTRQSASPLPAAIVQPERLAPPQGTPLPSAQQQYEFAPLSSISTNIAAPAGELPAMQVVPQPLNGNQPLRGEFVYAPDQVAIPSTSRARNFCHRPLYFEDPALERDGCTVGVLQPVVSGARFVATIPALPYLIASRPPRSCVCTDAAGVPHQQITPADRRRGVAAQAATAVGLIFVLP